VLFEQVPHVPWTQAIPPPHWLLVVQFAQRPLMHTSPVGPAPPLKGKLQSANVVHGLHMPLLQTRPSRQPKAFTGLVGPHPPSMKTDAPVVQTPDEQRWPDAHWLSSVHVHCIPVWVAAQLPLGPHCAADVHATHVWLTHAWPALHCQFEVQVVQPIVHSTQVRYSEHVPVAGSQ
jgi:hypothetical protein